MKTIRGVIALVQEHRLQLIDEDGVYRMFIVSHDAPVEWSDLKALEKQEQEVLVRYTEAQGLIAHTAHDVQPLAALPAAARETGISRPA